ncbi:MAG: hypothetical protein AUG49_12240 [Catenulispora sp. 13_1_20CM_3_70_7]|nr:MAG: hypothetical protein AUG49_12240 [Catenulispora sp. 13_1_20CM_3_70_7]
MGTNEADTPKTGRWIPTAAVTTAAVLACAAGVWGYHAGRTGAVRVDLPASSDPAIQASCTNLIKALPSDVEGGHRRGVVGDDRNVKRRAAAWGYPATILRCGVTEPPEITVGGPDYTPLKNRYANMGDSAFVNWLIQEHEHSVTYTTTDRAAYVEVIVPFDDELQKEAASNALVDLAPMIVMNIPDKAGKFVDDQPE